MSDGGKGDRPRPLSVPRETFDNNFDAIFRKNKTPPKDIDQQDTVKEKNHGS